MTPGFLFAYGSWDDEGGSGGTGAGFSYEDDFNATVILDDEYAWGNTGTNNFSVLTAWWV